MYEKLWSELSSNDRKVLVAMVEAEDQKVSSIREKAEKIRAVLGYIETD